ncbi:MAG: ABC transporter ATP-binding protein [Ilumatobacteraceae bacterium]|uniref:ABC transporter ATP-binding protein n=1 Tax=Ilumatobacter fluminis TaxID=467091 RepID=UPI00296A6B02|nr:ABC transporter ATP-binding protein [Ilumatobacteraceae bacterium]
MTMTDTDQPPAFELREVSKRFSTKKGQLPVVRSVEMHARRGEFISIIGPSGCGKSTLFKMIAGLEQPSDGEIRVDGHLATGHTEEFAYMPQKDLLFPWRTILDNTTMGLEVQGMSRSAARAKARPLFETFGIAGFEDSYPWQLSGGMRQRAALLRTVVQDRPVLLLDEPFGALDSLTRVEMQEWLTEVWEQFRWTVVLITHDIREAVFLSDRVYVLTARPAGVREVHEIDLERPRDLGVVTDARFAQFEASLLEALREESRVSHAQDDVAP